ncbi:MAG: hypothetical protein Q4Q23_07790 [Methanobacteriaceae archaeon]|nr:hypothetical protein [Methanobacteriaceae archaeon]
MGGTINIYNATFNKNSALAIITDGWEDSSSFGGAIYNTGNITLTNIDFTENKVSGGHDGLAYGGAIYTNKSLNLTGIKFVNNSVSSSEGFPNGGAIYSENSLNITNSIFINNYVVKYDWRNYAVITNNSIYCSNNSYYYYAENNWWGTNTPDWNQTLYNVNIPNSWIYLKVTLSKDNINVAENTQIKTDFNWLTNGKNVTAYSNNILDGLNISYALTKNIVKTTPIINTIQNGTSTTIFTGTKNGITNITLKTDNIPTNEIMFLTVNALPTSTKITYITPNITPGSNMTIQASITDKDNKPITIGEVVIKINGKTLKDEYGQSIKIPVVNGTINYNHHIPYNYSTKQYNLTVKYLRNDKYTLSEQTINFTITKEPTSTKITYITPNTTHGSNMTIQASITDKNKQPITIGEAIIKINGKTLENEYRQSIKIPVNNGAITYTYLIPDNYSAKTYNITVKYIKNNKYTPSEQTINFTITKTQTKIQNEEICPIPPGTNLPIKANITDKNNNPITTGYVIFKINGKTLNDINGNNIKVNVTNGKIEYNYTIPKDYSTKQYNLTVKYMNSTQYQESQETINFTIQEIIPTITKIELIEPVTLESDLNIKANITDKNNNPIDTGYVIFKIDNNILKDTNNNTITANVTNGKIEYNYTIPDNYSATSYYLTVKYIGTNHYLESQDKTTFLVSKY